MFNPQSAKKLHFYIPLQCIWLKLNGSWPLEYNLRNCTIRRKNCFRIAYTCWSWYVIVSVGITICFQTSFLVQNIGDIIMITENCCTTLMGVLNFIRLIHLRLNQNQLRNLVQEFVNNIWIPE
ncbi:hypothetical protein KR093_001999 [Drosophila rubida]|uniref:Uncharacterized protein n=1 Tax=Drosophila rubida TaxID=30044 RepID=A0AAD4K6L6_9MUSC|nr:hypothetical protein KR093_001998 [Drosophila rubida]KAH8380688.1 hypothetical protein KR093_001999 [Drosophila rubida]